MDNDIEENQDLPKSKSQVKREMIELQALGERLLTLNDEQLKRLTLPKLLMQAIQEAKKMSNRGARRRQLQYIGRLMRDIEDPNYIRDFLGQLEMKSQKAAAYHHMLEAWRERLLSDESALTEFINAYPNVDRQQLRQLVIGAKKERLTGKPVGAGKLLFRYLRELQLDKNKSDNGNSSKSEEEE